MRIRPLYTINTIYSQKVHFPYLTSIDAFGYIRNEKRQPNKALHTDFNGRPPLKSGLLPKTIFIQLGGKRVVTGMAGIPVNVLLSKQSKDCRQGHGAHITI